MQEERYNAVLLQVKEDMLCDFYAGWHVMSDKPSPQQYHLSQQLVYFTRLSGNFSNPKFKSPTHSNKTWSIFKLGIPFIKDNSSNYIF